MKRTFNYILVAFAMLAPVVASADDDVTTTYHNEGKGVATNKTVTGPNSDGSYTITLETFATGESVTIDQALPADIVLVLDLSQSMTQELSSSTSYTEINSQAYSYSTYGNNQYYYLHTDGEYYRVSRGYYETGNGNNVTRHYYLTFSVNGTDYYLYDDYETGVTTDRPANPSGRRQNGQWQNTNATIWTGVLYRQTTTRISRLDALQASVESFLEVIYHNDNYEDDTFAKLRRAPLGNRLSIVTFGGPQNNTAVTKINSNLTNVSNSDRSKNSSMISDLLALNDNSISGSDHYGTYSDEGMVLANSVLNDISAERKEVSSRTVVLFTDGAPGEGPNWTTGNNATNSIPTSNRAIAAALTAKSTHEATVYTVVLGGIANVDMRHYLEYTSSNYPDAENLDTPHEEGGGDYQLEAGEDLEGVFTIIAQQSGGSSQSIPASTQVRDVVSSSFNLPEGFNSSNVTVYTVDVKPSGVEFYGPEDEDYAAHKNVLTIVSSDEEAMNDESKVALHIESKANGDAADKLVVQGFDYSKEDGEVLGSGNWVGPRISGTSSNYYGKKLVIEFNIKPDGEATGGNATNTNAEGSGVFVKNESGDYVSVNDYVKPHTDLPTVLKISKKGLRRGESATFQIVRYRPLGWNESNPSDISNYQWTVVGKPKPDPTTVEDFSKVILTNKNGTEETEIVKILRALDPSWIYEVYEDDWAWSYVYDGSTSMNTSDVEVNPFRFTNSKNEDAVKHSEAVSINHFANETIGLESRVENVKSGESFDANQSSRKSK